MRRGGREGKIRILMLCCLHPLTSEPVIVGVDSTKSLHRGEGVWVI